MERVGLNETRRITIAKKADALLKKYQIDLSQSIDIIDLAKKMGFVVGNANLPETEDGFIYVNENTQEVLEPYNTNKLIGVNADRDLPFKRFVIAHEIGHYEFAAGAPKVFAHRENRIGKDLTENEIDYFAACLLMPSDSFRDRFLDLQNSGITEMNDFVEQLAKIYLAPAESVRRRIQELKLIATV